MATLTTVTVTAVTAVTAVTVTTVIVMFQGQLVVVLRLLHPVGGQPRWLRLQLGERPHVEEKQVTATFDR